MIARLEYFQHRPEAAAALGMKLGTYESHENGNRAQRGIPIEYARQYARRFHVSLNWLLTGQGDRKSAEGIEVRGFIGAGAEVEEHNDSARFEELGISVDDADEYEWYEVVGASMEPRVYPGEFVAFERKHYNLDEILRKECLVKLPDGRRFFKKLNPGSAPGLYDLISYNDVDRPDEEVSSAGKLAMIVSRVRKV